MALIDAKTNFMLLMSLMKILPREMAPAIGTDATLISRWRTGKRRLIAGRPWVKKVAHYFVEQDAERDIHCLRPIMNALYPAKPTDTEAQLIACVTQFLLCPGQLEPEYRRRRYDVLNSVLPGCLAAPKDPKEAVDHIGEVTYGRQKLMGAVMEFLGEVLKIRDERRRMIVVAPEGLNALMRIDPAFSAKLVERMLQLFEMGHMMALIVHPNYEPEGSDLYLARLEAMHLRGYIETHYCEEFRKPEHFRQTLIMTTRREISVSITIPGGDFDHANILTVKSPVTAGKSYFMALKLRNRMPMDHQIEMLERPIGYIAGYEEAARRYDGPLYYLSDIPFFCTLPAAQMQSLYGLSDDEFDLVASEFWPLLMEPGRCAGRVMRHVLCRDEIERALIMDDAEVSELSQMLGREVRIGRRQVTALLRRLIKLTEAENYELALLPRHVVDRLNLRGYLMGGCALASGIDGRSCATTDPRCVRQAMLYGEQVWRRIPSGMKNKQGAARVMQSLIDAHGDGGHGLL